MKFTKEQQQFIKDATTNSDVCSDWRTKIKETFPKLFKETELEIGKWYRDTTSKTCLILYNGGRLAYGFGRNTGDWLEDYIVYNSDLTDYKLATDKEVEEALIKEAKKRGFKEGVVVDCFLVSGNGTIDQYDEDNVYYEIDDKNSLNYGNKMIYKEGKWATIIETITKEQAEKELGKTIVD